jgi:lysophospholipase L1-like esterase
MASSKGLPVHVLWSRLLLIALVNLILIEVLVRAVNFIIPLERPPKLADSYTNEWIEGNDWFNGLTRFYKYKPSTEGRTYGHPFRVNHWGFRGHDFEDRTHPETKNSFRIMVLGDSITAGLGIAEEDRYSELLERELRRGYPSRQLEVINLGVQGFETVQEVKMLQYMGESVQPNLVILGFCENDPNIHYSYYQKRKFPMPEAARSLLEHLLAFRQAELLYDPLVRMVKGLPTHEKEVMAAYKQDTPDWNIFVVSVQRIAAWAREHTGSAPIVIFLADVQTAKAEGWYSQVRAVFEQSGFIWSEMMDGARYEPVSRYEGHPNEATHQFFAQALSRTITDRHLIPLAP